MGMSAAHCQGNVREFQCLESGHPACVMSTSQAHCIIVTKAKVIAHIILGEGEVVWGRHGTV